MDSGYLFGVIVGSLVMGCIVGLPPFLWARYKGCNTVGIVCMLCCVVGHFILGLLLSIPICIVCLIVVALQKSPAEKEQNNQANVYNQTNMNTQQNSMQTSTANSASTSTQTSVPTQAFCPQCGNKLEEGEVYCTKCGNAL